MIVRFKRGNEANLPRLITGEPAITLDSSKVFIGGVEENVELPTRDYVDTELAEKAQQKQGEIDVALGKVEGFPTDQYKHTIAHSQEVNDTTNRYWTLIGDVSVPVGSLSRQDHLGVRGQAITEAPQTRIWGATFLASMLPSSKPSDNDKTKLPSLIGTEIDVNNSSGLDITDLSYQEIVGLLIASGGSNQPFAGWVVQKAPTAGKWFTGGFFKDNSIQYGIMFDDVSPNNAFYFTDSYTGGAIINVKQGTNILDVRHPDATTSTLSVDGNKNMIYTGTFEPHVLKQRQTILPSGTVTIDASQGNMFSTVNSTTTTVTAITNGKNGQEITFVFVDNNTTIQHNSTIKLSGGVNFVGTVNDTLKLISDGVNWFEVSRSINGN